MIIYPNRVEELITERSSPLSEQESSCDGQMGLIGASCLVFRTGGELIWSLTEVQREGNGEGGGAGSGSGSSNRPDTFM